MIKRNQHIKVLFTYLFHRIIRSVDKVYLIHNSLFKQQNLVFLTYKLLL